MKVTVRLLVLLLLVFLWTPKRGGTAGSAQQAQGEHSILVWSPTGCNVCGSVPGPVAFLDGDRVFTEKIEGTELVVFVGLVDQTTVFAVRVMIAFLPQANRETLPRVGHRTVIGDLTENVTLEVPDSRRVLHSVAYDGPIAGEDGYATRFDSSSLTLNVGDHFQGYLFFPTDSSIDSVFVVIKTPREIFRFPFARDPRFRAKFAAPMPNISSAPETVGKTVETELTRGGNRVSFACADQSGVHLCVPSWVSDWVRKNGAKFPDLSFHQTPISNGRNYLVVFSSSERVLYGFDPVVTRSTTTKDVPVTGIGTVVDNGSVWTFTFNGTATVTTMTATEEAVPYSVQTKTSVVRTYDEHGALVSEHRRRVSTKQGGDSAGSIGYNSVAILSGIIRRNSVLLNETIEDILKNVR